MGIAEWWIALGGIFLLGLQTSISPCPLMANITAISFIGMRGDGKRREVLKVGFLYATGQMLAYSLAAFCILYISLFSGDRLTRLMTSTLHLALGPILILIGMVLSGIISFPMPGLNGERAKKLAEKFGIWSAFPLGMVFAMAFCPTTAAMFLAMLTISIKAGSSLIFPLIFGLGAAFPVVICAFVLAFQIHRVGKMFGFLGKIDFCLRSAAGAIFIITGIVMSLRTVIGLM